MPIEIVQGFAYLKKAAAYTNCELGVLSSEKRDLIAMVCDEILEGKHDDQFPLSGLANRKRNAIEYEYERSCFNRAVEY